MSVTTNISWHLGEDVQLNGTPETVVDISDWTVELEIYQGGAVILTVAAAITDGPAGVFVVVIPAATTTELGLGTFAYQIRRLDFGFVTVIANGSLLAVQ